MVIAEHLSGGYPTPLSQRDIQVISQSLIGMVSVGEKITFECMDNEPPAGSEASEMFYTFDRTSAQSYVMDAFLLMQHANLSGFDNVRALVALIRTKPPRSTSLAAVTRAALEAFSRTWLLLSASGPEELIHRHLSLLYSDLRHPALNNTPMASLDGDPFDPVERRFFYAAELERLGLPAPLKIELSRLTADLLDAEFEDGKGARRYSDLSAIAHGQRLGTNTFVIRDDTGGIGGLVAPREVVEIFATESLASISAATEAFIRVFGNQVRHMELFSAASDRAAVAMSRFDDS